METITRKEIQQMLGELSTVRTLQKNQVVVRYENGNTFLSYGTLIGAQVAGRLYLTWYHDYSRTTSKYTKQWCGLSLEERRKGLKDGSIIEIEYPN